MPHILTRSSPVPAMPLFFRPFAGRETERPAVRQKGSGNIHTGVDIAGLSHEQLVVRVATERDRAAFRILFDHYAPRLKSYLVTLGLGDERAEDLAQETLVTVWQKAEQFQPDKARLSTWMFRIARNKFIDQTRRQKYPEVDADDHLQHLVSDDKADTGAIEGQMADRVATAMARLKENQRQVIELSFFEELSHTEIAERLSLPLGTVKSRIRIAFEALRNELGEFK